MDPLDRLDELPRAALTDRKAVVVLLHGLLSTDVGLFDPIVRLLRSDSTTAKEIPIVGWPHDTLAGIGTNALQLRRLIDDVIGVQGPPVAFVCHSRGGLLARCVAVHLSEKHAGWVQKLRACVTFGTPHEGCPLAEAPGDLLGKAIAVGSWRAARGAFSLLDGLEYTHLARRAEGIEDLRPLTGRGTFLKELLEREAKFAPRGERALDIFAVGGETPQAGLFGLLSKRALAGRPNDLVVELRSSVPRFAADAGNDGLARSGKTDCDHFTYFTDAEAQKSHFADAIAFLERKLDQKIAAAANVAAFQGEGGPDDPRRQRRRPNWSAANVPQE